MLTLSRRIPARTKTIKLKWIEKYVHPMSPKFRAIRGGSRNPMDRCHWCSHPFEDGEEMWIGCMIGKGNKMFCQKCADKARESGNGGD